MPKELELNIGTIERRKNKIERWNTRTIIKYWSIRTTERLVEH